MRQGEKCHNTSPRQSEDARAFLQTNVRSPALAVTELPSTMLAASRFGLLRPQSTKCVAECISRSTQLASAPAARQLSSVALSGARSATYSRKGVRQPVLCAATENKQRGHQAPASTNAPDPAVLRIREHQSAAQRQTFPDECKTLVDVGRYGVLSTISKEYNGHPNGSIVGFASDDKVRSPGARRACRSYVPTPTRASLRRAGEARLRVQHDERSH